MPRDASGNYTLPSTNPVLSGDIITTAWGNGTMSDIATALQDSLSRTGQGGMQANLPMGGFQVKAVGAASVATDVPTAVQIRNGAFSWLTGVSSDAPGNAYVGTALLTDADTNGTVYFFLCDKTNTGAMTLNVNGGGALAIQYNGAAITAGLVQGGTVISVVRVASTYRVIGGVSAPSANGLNSVTNSDPAALEGTLAANVLTLTPHTNVGSGLVKLDAGGKIPATLLNPVPMTFVGEWDAGPGNNPTNGTAAGQFYQISGAGNLTIFRTSVAPAYTAQVTAVVPGDFIVWNTLGSADQPVGWYYIPGSAAATTAAGISNTATPSFPAVTNLQSWMNSVDPFYMPKGGGTFTGQVVQAAAPSSGGALANRDYVDNKFASIPANVSSFNTRQGAVTLTSGDVTGALTYTPVNKTGDTMSGALGMGNNDLTNIKTAYFNSQVSPGATTGAVSVTFVSGQKQKLTLTGPATLSFSFPGVGHYQLWLVPGANAVTWPTIGASWQWLGAIAAPSLNTGTYGSVINLYYDGSMVMASHSKVGAV